MGQNENEAAAGKMRLRDSGERHHSKLSVVVCYLVAPAPTLLTSHLILISMNA